MLNTNRYEMLKEMLSENYNVSEFQDGNESPYFIIGKQDNLYITVTQEIDYLEVIVEQLNPIEDEYYVIETKKYKTGKGAYNMIYRVLQ